MSLQEILKYYSWPIVIKYEYYYIGSEKIKGKSNNYSSDDQTSEHFAQKYYTYYYFYEWIKKNMFMPLTLEVNFCMFLFKNTINLFLNKF